MTLALVMHLVPSLLVLLVLAAAWRREWIGALCFIGFALSYVISTWGRLPLSVYFAIAGPLTVGASPYLVGWFHRLRVSDGLAGGV